MPGSPEDRLHVAAVLGALKEAGIRVKNWKSALSVSTTKQENQCTSFAFGRDLDSLPQCHLPDLRGTVPQFLVDACEFLSQHLHTEGLFRKTGSLSRIRTLRVALEQGQLVFSLPLSAALQPCDVATMLKQFLRELPSPLIPYGLQGPLCHAQNLGPEGFLVGGKDGAILLITTLFPPSHARALRYFCTFLRNTAKRCSENRMEVGSLALVITPNLLHCIPGGSRLTVGTEKLLDRQAEVVRVLIEHADRIGIVPAVLMNSVSTVAEDGATTPPADGVGFSERVGLGVYRSLRRQRRRSVGEIFVEAFSKLKTGRTLNGPSPLTENISGLESASYSSSQFFTAPGQQTPRVQSPPSHTTKRKSTEDTVPEMEGSAKKRKSIHDLREDNKPVTPSCCHESKSTTMSSPSVALSVVESCEEQEPWVPYSTLEKRRSEKRDAKRLQRCATQENRVERRRKSLRFFTLTSWSSPSTNKQNICEADSCLMSGKKVTDSTEEPPSSGGVNRFGAPVILIESPGGVLVGREVEDDPDLLNCSFAEEPYNFLPLNTVVALGKPPVEAEAKIGLKNGSENGKAGEHSTAEEIKGEEEQRVEAQNMIHKSTTGEAEKLSTAEAEHSTGQQGSEQGGTGESQQVVNIYPRVSQRYRPPRRSISLPDVTAKQVERQEVVDKEESEKEDIVDILRDSWSVQETVRDSAEQALNSSEAIGKKHIGVGEIRWELKRCMVTKTKKDQEVGKVTVRAQREVELESGFKRSHQRMSVGDRVRRFNMSSFLKAPRTSSLFPLPQKSNVPQELHGTGPPRTAVRLRRQGARRFSRSISHEGVSSLLQRQSMGKQPEQPQLCEKVPGQKKPRKQSEKPQQRSRLPHDLSQGNGHQVQCRQQLHHVQEKLQCLRHPEREWYPPCKQLGEMPQTKDLEEPQCHQMLQEQGMTWCQEGEQQMGLHELLELKLQLQHSEKESQRKSDVLKRESQPDQDALCPSVIPMNQEPSKEVTSSSLPSPSVLFKHQEKCVCTESINSPHVSAHNSQTAPPDTDVCNTPQLSPKTDAFFDFTSPLSRDFLLDIEGKELDGISDSPGTLENQAFVTRRRYRDSPRWPLPDIHIATWNPLQL